MATALDYTAVPKDKDDVRVLDRSQTVSDHQDRPALCRTFNGRLHQLLGLRVKAGRGFIEKQQLWVPYQGTGYAYTLLLASAQCQPFLSYLRVVTYSSQSSSLALGTKGKCEKITVRKGYDKVVNLCVTTRLVYLLGGHAVRVDP